MSACTSNPGVPISIEEYGRIVEYTGRKGLAAGWFGSYPEAKAARDNKIESGGDYSIVEHVIESGMHVWGVVPFEALMVVSAVKNPYLTNRKIAEYARHEKWSELSDSQLQIAGLLMPASSPLQLAVQAEADRRRTAVKNPEYGGGSEPVRWGFISPGGKEIKPVKGELHHRDMVARKGWGVGREDGTRKGYIAFSVRDSGAAEFQVQRFTSANKKLIVNAIRSMPEIYGVVEWYSYEGSGAGDAETPKEAIACLMSNAGTGQRRENPQSLLELLSAWRATGGIAFHYPRKKRVSFDGGRSISEVDAIAKLKRDLPLAVANQVERVKMIEKWEAKKNPQSMPLDDVAKRTQAMFISRLNPSLAIQESVLQVAEVVALMNHAGAGVIHGRDYAEAAQYAVTRNEDTGATELVTARQGLTLLTVEKEPIYRGGGLTHLAKRAAKILDAMETRNPSKKNPITHYGDDIRYHQIIPDVRMIRVRDLKPMNSYEVRRVSSEIAHEMRFNEPVEVTVFADGELRISDGHHRVAAAKQMGVEALPVILQSINAKGSTIRHLIEDSNKLMIKKEVNPAFMPNPRFVDHYAKGVKAVAKLTKRAQAYPTLYMQDLRDASSKYAAKYEEASGRIPDSFQYPREEFYRGLYDTLIGDGRPKYAVFEYSGSDQYAAGDAKSPVFESMSAAAAWGDSNISRDDHYHGGAEKRGYCTRFVRGAARNPDTRSSDVEAIDRHFPMAGEIVDGRDVMSTVPNMGSIAASLDDWETLDEIREVSFDDFDQYERSSMQGLSKRTRLLAEQIQQNNRISPLIVVIDKEGPYVLEGGHRFDALGALGAKSFPAVVVVEITEVAESIEASQNPSTLIEPWKYQCLIGVKGFKEQYGKLPDKKKALKFGKIFQPDNLDAFDFFDASASLARRNYEYPVAWFNYGQLLEPQYKGTKFPAPLAIVTEEQWQARERQMDDDDRRENPAVIAPAVIALPAERFLGKQPDMNTRSDKQSLLWEVLRSRGKNPNTPSELYSDTAYGSHYRRVGKLGWEMEPSHRSPDFKGKLAWEKVPKSDIPVIERMIASGKLLLKSNPVDRRKVYAGKLASDYKARGIGRSRAWSEFVIDRRLSPEIDASEFYAHYDIADPTPLVDASDAVPEAQKAALGVDPEFADHGARVRVTSRPGTRHEEVQDGVITRTLIGGDGTPVYEVDFGGGYGVRVPSGDKVEMMNPKKLKAPIPESYQVQLVEQFGRPIYVWESMGELDDNYVHRLEFTSLVNLRIHLWEMYPVKFQNKVLKDLEATGQSTNRGEAAYDAPVWDGFLHNKAVWDVRDVRKKSNPFDWYDFGWTTGMRDYNAKNVGLDTGDPIVTSRGHFQFMLDSAKRHESFTAAQVQIAHDDFVRGFYHGIEGRPKGKNKGIPKGARRIKSNPSSSAAEVFEMFHGEPSNKELVYRYEEHEHEHLAQIGPLVSLKFITPFGKEVTMLAPDPDGGDLSAVVQLCCSENRTQLYFTGGEQEIPREGLEKMGFAEGSNDFKDLMLLGVLCEVTYRTKKGFDKFKLTDYYHELGEETGVEPVLLYDLQSGLLRVAGGQYRIEDVGICN